MRLLLLGILLGAFNAFSAIPVSNILFTVTPIGSVEIDQYKLQPSETSIGELAQRLRLPKLTETNCAVVVGATTESQKK